MIVGLFLLLLVVVLFILKGKLSQAYVTLTFGAVLAVYALMHHMTVAIGLSL